MSIASEISRLNTAKADIKTALEGKGISVSSTLKIDGYAELIALYVLDIRVVAKYNVTNTSSPTQICTGDGVSGFSAIEIDGVAQQSVVTTYTFSTTGEHTVRFTLTDPTSIGNCAFKNCSGLTSVTIPNSVANIGSAAFSGTAWYNNQPDGLVYAGKVAYRYKGEMPSNTSIIIKDGTLGIGDGAFYGCSGLTSITIPNSVEGIGL